MSRSKNVFSDKNSSVNIQDLSPVRLNSQDKSKREIVVNGFKFTRSLDQKVKFLEDFSFDPFPENIAQKVKFSMAFASNYLAKRGTKLEKTSVVIRGHETFAKFIWTALMVFGEQYKPKFGNEVVDLNETLFRQDKEIGYFSTFSKSSLYETQFKQHITPDMLQISKSVALYHDIPASEDIKEQQNLKKKQLIEIYENTLRSKYAREAQLQLKKEELIQQEKIRQEEAMVQKQLKAAQEQERIRIEEMKRQEQDRILAESQRQYMAYQAQEAQRIAEIRRLDEIRLREDAARKQEELRRQAEAKRIEECRIQENARRIEEEKRREEIRQQQSNALINAITNTESIISLFAIKQFLKNGADINFRDLNGNTPLLHALSLQKDNIAEYLFKNGAEPSIANNDGELPSSLISPFSSLFTQFKEKEKQAQLDKLWPSEKYGILLLEHIASPEAQIQKIDEYLNKTHINYKNHNGYTPLMIAVDMQNDRIAEYLLKIGADPLQKNNKGRTARDLTSRNSAIHQIIKGYELLFFTQSGNLSAIHSLLNNDPALIDFQGNNGYTALLVAVELDMFDIVEYLLSREACIYITCEDGNGVFDLIKDQKMQSLFGQNENDLETSEPLNKSEHVRSAFGIFPPPPQVQNTGSFVSNSFSQIQ